MSLLISTDNEPLVALRPKSFISEFSATIIHCSYYSKPYYKNGGRVCIAVTTYLINKNEYRNRLQLLHAINIPIAPDKHFFRRNSELLRFTLMFEKLPYHWTTFNLCEDPKVGKHGFFVNNIQKNNTGVYRIIVG